MIKSFELGQYKGFKIKQEKIDVTEQEIFTLISDVQQLHATKTEKTDKIKKGDHVYVNYECHFNGTKYDAVSGSNIHIKIGAGGYDVKFETNLLSHSKGDNFTFEYEADDTFIEESLKGKKVEFKVEILKIEEKLIPELNDVFIKSLKVPHLKTVDDMIFSSRRELVKRKEATKHVDYINDVMRIVLDNASIQYNESEVEKSMDRILEQLKVDLKEKDYTFDVFLEHEQYESEADFWKEGVQEIKTKLLEEQVIENIIKLENIEVSHDEYQEVLNQYLNNHNVNEDDFDDHDEFMKSLKYKKTIDYLCQVNSAE